MIPGKAFQVQAEHDFSLFGADGNTEVDTALSKQCISCYVICSLLALRAQSSAKKKSLMTVFFTFGTAFRRLRLNSPPLVLYLTGIPTLQSWKAQVTMVENTVLKSVGARTQPCFTPFITGKASEWSQSSGTLTIMQS